MKLRAIIIDDEEIGIETLRLIIEKHALEVKVVASCTSPTQAIELLEDYMPEIVFLDISMPEMSGFELLEKLSWKNFNLIFTTAHREHALKALKINAIDYLLKPVDPKDLDLAIQKIKKQNAYLLNPKLDFDYASITALNYNCMNKLAVNSKEGIEYVNPLEIVSLESKSNYTMVSLTDTRLIVTPKTLREFDNHLCNCSLNFMRVHHSFLINLHQVLRFNKEHEHIIMVNKQKIPLSKSRRNDFLNWLTM